MIRFGCATGCEAGLGPAVSSFLISGLCPVFGNEQKGAAQFHDSSRRGGASPASHPAAKPYWEMFIPAESLRLCPLIK